MEDALVEVDILVISFPKSFGFQLLYFLEIKVIKIFLRKNWQIRIVGGLTAFAYSSTFIIEGIFALSLSY